MNFSEQLKAAQRAAGLTQAELAKKLDLSPRIVSYYITGKRTPGKAVKAGILALLLGFQVDGK